MAVLEETSVMKVVPKQMTRSITKGGRDLRPVSWRPRYRDRPDSLVAAAIAKPPPRTENMKISKTLG